MKIEISASNIKCQGCASSIASGLGENPQVQSVSVDVATGVVVVECVVDISNSLRARLAELGYPAQD